MALPRGRCGGQASVDLPRVAAPSRPDTLAAAPVPTTFEQALNALDRGLSGGAFQAMQVLSEDDAVALFYRMHHGGGVLWQSPWNLTFDGPLHRELSRSGFRHPDDMSEALLRSFWRRLHNRPIELASQAREANAVRDAARIAPYWVMFSEQSAVSLAHQCSRQAPLLAEFPKGATSWQTSPVVVCDGGRWYFGAESDPSTRRAGLVTFN